MVNPIERLALRAAPLATGLAVTLALLVAPQAEAKIVEEIGHAADLDSGEALYRE